MTIQCTHYVSQPKGSLLGYAEIYVPKWGVEISRVAYLSKDDRRWVNMPQYIADKDPMTGRGTFLPFIKLRDKAFQKLFLEAVKTAIEEYIINNEPKREEDAKEVHSQADIF